MDTLTDFWWNIKFELFFVIISNNLYDIDICFWSKSKRHLNSFCIKQNKFRLAPCLHKLGVDAWAEFVSALVCKVTSYISFSPLVVIHKCLNPMTTFKNPHLWPALYSIVRQEGWNPNIFVRKWKSPEKKKEIAVNLLARLQAKTHKLLRPTS